MKIDQSGSPTDSAVADSWRRLSISRLQTDRPGSPPGRSSTECPAHNVQVKRQPPYANSITDFNGRWWRRHPDHCKHTTGRGCASATAATATVLSETIALGQHRQHEYSEQRTQQTRCLRHASLKDPIPPDELELGEGGVRALRHDGQ